MGFGGAEFAELWSKILILVGKLSHVFDWVSFGHLSGKLQRGKKGKSGENGSLAAWELQHVYAQVVLMRPIFHQFYYLFGPKIGELCAAKAHFEKKKNLSRILLDKK